MKPVMTDLELPNYSPASIMLSRSFVFLSGSSFVMRYISHICVLLLLKTEAPYEKYAQIDQPDSDIPL